MLTSTLHYNYFWYISWLFIGANKSFIALCLKLVTTTNISWTKLA
jgi:hypothetical protein